MKCRSLLTDRLMTDQVLVICRCHIHLASLAQLQDMAPGLFQVMCQAAQGPFHTHRHPLGHSLQVRLQFLVLVAISTNAVV